MRKSKRTCLRCRTVLLDCQRMYCSIRCRNVQAADDSCAAAVRAIAQVWQRYSDRQILLSLKQYRILQARMAGRSFRAIAPRFGITFEAIRQQQNTGLNVLRTGKPTIRGRPANRKRG